MSAVIGTYPLPLYEARRLGVQSGRDGSQFIVYVGLDRAMVAALREKSLDQSDDEVQKNTSDPERFGRGSYEEWYSKKRVPYALIHNDGRLAALSWFGPKPLGRKSLKYLSEAERARELSQKEDIWHTVVYRSYPPFRGAGLMKTFMTTCMEDYLQAFPGAKLWVGLSSSNAASKALATKLGFIEREDLVDTEKQWLAMIKE